MQFYAVKVKFENESEKGKIKFTSETYLVDSVSPTESEARATQFLVDAGETRAYEVTSCVKSKIIDVIK